MASDTLDRVTWDVAHRGRTNRVGSMRRGPALMGAAMLVALAMTGCGSGGQQSSPAAEATPSPTTMSQERACEILGDSYDDLRSDIEAAGIPLDSPTIPPEEPARSAAQDALDKYRASLVEVRENGPDPLASEMRKMMTLMDAAGFFSADTPDDFTPEPAQEEAFQDGYNSMLTLSSACNDPELFGPTEPSGS